MKRLLLIIVLLLCLVMVGCGTFGNETECGMGYTLTSGVAINYCVSLTTEPTVTTTTTKPITTTAELPRYRVKVVEIVTGDGEGEVGYIVSKDGYTIGGIYTLETEDNFLMGETIYVVIVDEYTAVPFWEWLEDQK